MTISYKEYERSAPWNDPDCKWVCENHVDKAWPDECNCGAGTPEPTEKNRAKGYLD